MTTKELLNYLTHTEDIIPKGCYPIVKIINSKNEDFKPIYYIIGVDFFINRIDMCPVYTGKYNDGDDNTLQFSEISREQLMNIFINMRIKKIDIDRQIQWYDARNMIFLDITSIIFDTMRNQILIDLIEV